jgi:hypothetical protein
MRRFLRLLTLWLLALAFPIQGATAATAMPMASPQAAQHAMHHDMSAMPGMAMAHDDGTPCAHHAMDKSGCCGACCGPVVGQQAALTVAPVADVWAPAARRAQPVVAPVFLTDGPDRPPRAFLA